MRIHVYWDDIRSGKRRSTTECMLALALKRELGIDYVSVGLCDIRLKMDGSFLTLHLPNEIGRRIRFWELFHFTLPFSFDFPGLAIGLSGRNASQLIVETEVPGGISAVEPALSAV